MKRVFCLLLVALVSCLAAPAVFSQGWTPGPPVSPMPQAGMPLPLMGQPFPVPGLDGSCGPVSQCQPMPCGLPKNASIAGLLGWQANQDSGFIKFSTRGHHLIQKTGTKINFNLQGLLVGASGRVPLSDNITLRAEYRHLFPSQQKVEDTITPLNVGAPGQRTFSSSRYYSDVVDGSAGLSICQGVSVLGGFRWDSMYVFLGNPHPIIPRFSSHEDEGDLTLSSLQPYAGAELAWTGCDSGLMLRVIGSPWTSTYTKFGLTFGNGGDPIRGPIRDSISVSSKYSSFVELTLMYGKRLGRDVTASGFAMVNAMCSHWEADMNSVRYAGTGAEPFPYVSVSVPFDTDMNRRAIVVGGNVAMSFSSPW